MISRTFLIVVAGILLLCASTATNAQTATKVEVVGPEEVGDVYVTWDNRKREALTSGAHAEMARLGPGGLIAWTWSKVRYQGLWVNEHIRVQKGKKLLFEAKSAKPFIEDFDFIKEGLVAKSRAMHGPAAIELYSLTDGKLIATNRAYGDDLPAWAKPYAE
jgi:hypothetical protein